MSNPYTLVFGRPPIEFVERSAQAERIVSEFCQDHPANFLNLITGVRGSGKTVDKTVVQAIAKAPTGEVSEIRKKLDYSSNQFNPYRDRLLKAGIISCPTKGVAEIALPWFGDFALKMERII